MLNYKPFIDAGITKIKHLVYEFIPGFLKPDAIFEILSEQDNSIKLAEAITYYNNIVTCLPREWIHWINTIVNPAGNFLQLTVDHFSFLHDDKNIPMPTNTRTFYDILVSFIEKPPISETFWTEKYPDIDLNMCYYVSNLNFIPSECKELSFLIIHKSLFTKKKLYRCAMTEDDICPICKQSQEDLEHLFLSCGDLSNFNDFIVDLLSNMFNSVDDDFVNALNFDQMVLFGIFGKRKGFNFYFANFLLNIVRLTVYKRRNFVLIHPDARINLIQYFKTLLDKYVSYYYYIYKSRKEENLIQKYLIRDNPMLKLSGDNIEIVY